MAEIVAFSPWRSAHALPPSLAPPSWRFVLAIERFVPVQLTDATPPAAPVHDDRPTDSADDRCHEDATPGGRMEIALDRGRRITVFADVDGEALRRVLAIVERR
jgi:hypothetical protein